MLETAYRTDTGNVRLENQDAMHVDKPNGIFVVADGMGGRQGGGVASAMTVDCVIEQIASRLAGAEDFDSLLRDAIATANERIYEMSERRGTIAGMGSTVVVAILKEENLYIAHVGDSRAYIFDGDALRLVTTDHTVANQLVRDGVMPAVEALSDHRRHVLTRAVGISEHLDADISRFDYHGETVLLCTDGLTDMVDDAGISRALEQNLNLNDACSRMIELANAHGGVDNTTVVIFRASLREQ